MIRFPLLIVVNGEMIEFYHLLHLAEIFAVLTNHQVDCLGIKFGIQTMACNSFTPILQADIYHSDFKLRQTKQCHFG